MIWPQLQRKSLVAVPELRAQFQPFESAREQQFRIIKPSEMYT